VVGYSPGDPRADRRAQQRDRDHESDLDRTDTEVFLDSGDGPVDDGAVIAEKKSADRRRGGDEDDVTNVLAGSTRWGGAGHDSPFPRKEV
jgi:hypothetical protein